MTRLVHGLGKKAAVDLIEVMAYTLEDQKSKTPPLLSNLTEGNNLDTDPYYYGAIPGTQESYRPTDAITIERVEDMRQCGQVVFGLEMKKAWIRSALRDDRSWEIECEDEKMQEVVHAMMSRVLEQHTGDFLHALDYGAYFGEKVWDRQPAVYWGIETQGNYIGYKEIAPIDPGTVQRILYKKKGHVFHGFVQTSRYSGEDIPVKPELALVLPYDMRFRNLWGNSALEPVYPVWVWYEIALRSWMRFLERMGTPVTIGYAPSRGQVRDQDNNAVRTMKYAFLMAGNAAKSNAIALPSDVDPDTGQQLWKLEYLDAPNKTPQFVEAVRLLGTQIVRSLVIGDRTAEQPMGETGSYSSSQVHFAVTMLHNEHVLQQFLTGFNKWLIPQIVEYNGSATTPPARIITESLDPEEKDRLFGLLNTMGNQADSSAMKAIDWRKIFAINNIPVLSEEEVKEIEEEAMQRQEQQMEMAAKFKEPQLPKEQQKTGGPPKPPTPGEQKVAQSADGILHYLSQGGTMPVALSANEAQEWVERLSDRPFSIAFFNPYHDELGRFTTNQGGGGIKGAAYKGFENAKKWVKDHESELITIGTAAAITLAVVGAAYVITKTGAGTSAKIPGDMISKIDIKGSLDGQTTARVHNAVYAGEKALGKMGVKLEPKTVVFDMSGGRDFVDHAGTAHLSAETTRRITESMADQKRGIDTVIHELFHSRSGSDPIRAMYAAGNQNAIAVEEGLASFSGKIGASVVHEGADYANLTARELGKIANASGSYIGERQRVWSAARWLAGKSIDAVDAKTQAANDRLVVGIIKKWISGDPMKVFNEIMEEYGIYLEDSDSGIVLYNPYHDELGRFATKQSAITVVGATNYPGWFDKLPEKLQDVFVAPAEFLTRKKSVLAGLARVGIELGSDIAFNKLTMALVTANAAALGMHAVSAIALGVFGVAASPAALIIGGAVVGVAATLAVSEFLDWGQSKVFHTYLNRFAPKDDLHLSNVGVTTAKKGLRAARWWGFWVNWNPIKLIYRYKFYGGGGMNKKVKGLGGLVDELSSLGGMRIPKGVRPEQFVKPTMIDKIIQGLAAGGTSVGATDVIDIISKMVLEEPEGDYSLDEDAAAKDDPMLYTRLFTAGIWPHVISILQDGRPQSRLEFPYHPEIAKMPGMVYDEEDELLVMDLVGCMRFAEAWADGDFPKIGNFEFGPQEVGLDLEMLEQMAEKKGMLEAEIVSLFNPHHDELGRFAPKPGGLHTKQVTGIEAGKPDIMLSDAEVKSAVATANKIQKDLKGEIRGTFKTDIIGTHSYKEFAEKGQIPKSMAKAIMGVAHEGGQLYISPAVVENLAGRRKAHNAGAISLWRNVPAGTMRVLSEGVIAHESLHARKRKYPIPYEADGRSVNPSKFGIQMEEGATELLNNVFLVRTGRATVSDISKAGTYKPYVFSMAREARARYPDNPGKALDFVARAHQTGFTPKGIQESFGGRYVSRNRPMQYNGNDLMYVEGNFNDLKFILQAAKSDVKLEEEEEVSTGFYGLLMEGKVKEALADLRENLTGDKLATVGEYYIKHATPEQKKLIEAFAEEMETESDDQGTTQE